MPQCCYLAKGAKRPSHTTNTIKFYRIPFDPCNSIKRFDLCPFDQKNSTYLQPPQIHKISTKIQIRLLFDQELRFSGLPELKFQKRELIKENGEKHFTKPDRKLIFEHEENMMCDVVNYLGIDKSEISGFHRLEKFDAASTRTRQMLVKFKNSYNVEKLLARASMVKNYEPEYDVTISAGAWTATQSRGTRTANIIWDLDLRGPSSFSLRRSQSQGGGTVL